MQFCSYFQQRHIIGVAFFYLHGLSFITIAPCGKMPCCSYFQQRHMIGVAFFYSHGFSFIIQVQKWIILNLYNTYHLRASVYVSFVVTCCEIQSCVCYVFVHVCLCVLCGHLLGKGWSLGSRLWCLTVSLSLSHWYSGSYVVLDCIYSWSLHPYLLCMPHVSS